MGRGGRGVGTIGVRRNVLVIKPILSVLKS